MVDSHCEIMWDDNSGAYLGRHPTANDAAGLDDAAKQALIAQQRLMSNMLGLRINKSLTIDAKLIHFQRLILWIYNAICYCKMVQPNTCAGGPYIKSNLENMKISHFKHDIPKVNL